MIVNYAAIFDLEKFSEINYEELRICKINLIATHYLISKLYDLIVKNEADIINIGTTHSEASRHGYVNQLVVYL